jgi:serine/threonine protein kinase
VFAVSQNVVFKCPTFFENLAPVQAEEMAESIKKMSRDPNIVHNILCVSEGLFMQRLDMALEFQISKSADSAINGFIQSRRIQQLTRGTAWLELLGYVHGDIRPAKILVDVTDNLRLTDFDAAPGCGHLR